MHAQERRSECVRGVMEVGSGWGHTGGSGGAVLLWSVAPSRMHGDCISGAVLRACWAVQLLLSTVCE